MQWTDVSLDQIEATASAALTRHGASAKAARLVARAIRRAEATGNVICGLYYLESYCVQLTSGRVKGDVVPVVKQPRPGAVTVDAGVGFAQVAFAAGRQKACAEARSQGIASLAIAHAHTCTSLGFFTEQIAGSGLIGIGFTNASAIVAPPGGRTRVLGTNPIAMSVPARGGGIAMQFDHSTSAVALGKITMAASAGEAIPPGWAVDAKGQPTTDPNAALKGALVSAGGHKGYSFGLMAELLAGALTGSVNSTDVVGLKQPGGPPHDLGQSYVLIDPEVHAGAAFWDRLEQLQKAVDADPGARLPGASRAEQDPVALDADLWALTQKLAGG